MNKKYLLWNNKGGVGKTFLSYMLAVEYALKHPDKDVVVIDACPQTNVSEMILGGNGKGAEYVNEFSQTNRTVAGYIKERFSKNQASRLGSESEYFVRAHKYNDKMPLNLFILPGDMDLDICSRLISHLGTSPIKKAWRISRSLINDLIESFEDAQRPTGREQVFFIDCNPSFSNYTENAVLASNRVIVPCTADAASIRGIKNVFNLIFNIPIDQSRVGDEFEDFYQDVDRNGMTLPKVHLFVQNRSRSNLKNAARAFQSHADEIDRVVKNIIDNHPGIFTSDALARRVVNVKDSNTLASIINHEGCPLSDLLPSRYQIYGQDTQANREQIAALAEDVSALVDLV